MSTGVLLPLDCPPRLCGDAPPADRLLPPLPRGEGSCSGSSMDDSGLRPAADSGGMGETEGETEEELCLCCSISSSSLLLAAALCLLSSRRRCSTLLSQPGPSLTTDCCPPQDHVPLSLPASRWGVVLPVLLGAKPLFSTHCWGVSLPVLLETDPLPELGPSQISDPEGGVAGWNCPS